MILSYSICQPSVANLLSFANLHQVQMINTEGRTKSSAVIVNFAR